MTSYPSTQQNALVRHSLDLACADPERVSELFYTRLFALEPALRALFRGDMREQGRKLMTMLRTSVALLDYPEQLAPEVRALGQRHHAYGVRPAHYRVAGEAMLWALGQVLGPALNADMRAAWDSVYRYLAHAMTAATPA